MRQIDFICSFWKNKKKKCRGCMIWLPMNGYRKPFTVEQAVQENRERDYGQKETGYQGCPLTRCIYGNKMRILQKACGFLTGI